MKNQLVFKLKEISMKNFFVAGIACLSLLCIQNESNAQINWSPAVQLITSGDNTDFVSQNGTFVLGINPGGDAITVGTAVFSPTDQLSGMPDGTITSVTSTQNGVLFTGAFSRVQQPTFGAGEFTDVDAVNLLTTACWNSNYDAANPDTITFSGLTPGDTYEIQMIVSDARDGGGGGVRDERWQFAFTNGVDDLVAVIGLLSHRPFNEADSPGMAGDFVIGTFVADDTGSQAFSMNATRGNSFGLDPADPENTQEIIEADQFILGESIDIGANDPPASASGGQTQINAMQLRNISDVTGGILGDSNVDGMVDFDDIAPFIGFLASGDFQFQSDIDGNLVVDFDDIAGFITILASP